MRLPSFEYLEPRNLKEALGYLASYAEKARLMAGGTDLIVRMKQRLAGPAYLISLKNLKELSFIRQEKGMAAIGAMTPLSFLLDSALIRAHFPALLEAIKRIGAPPVQHFRGTIGGNLCLQTRCLY